MAGYQDLLVWQQAMALAESVYKETRRLPSEELYGLTSQARRASVSIAANIAEGHARAGRKEYLQFLAIARGSQAELATLLLLAQRIYPTVHLEEAIDANTQVGKMLTKLRQSLTSEEPQPLSSP